MTNSIPLIIDLVLVIIGISILLRCWKVGFLASIVRLVGTLAAYAGAWLFSRPAAEYLYNTFVHARLVEYAAEKIPPEVTQLAGSASSLVETLGLEQVLAALRTQVEQVLDSLSMGGGLPFFQADADALSRNLLDQVVAGTATDKLSLAETLVEALLRSGVLLLLQLVCFAAIFALLSIVVTILIKVARGVNYLPVIGSLNHLLGGVVGVAEAVLVVYLLCLVLTLVSGLFGNAIDFLNWDIVGQSSLVQTAVGVQLPGALRLLP